MFASMREIEYWKVVDQYKLTMEAHKYSSTFHVVYDGGAGLYHIAATALGINNDKWHHNTGTFLAKDIHEANYYHLTGIMDESDYASPEEFISDVDEFVLAKSDDEVLKNAGYWPEYDKSGAKAWHWLHGPSIILANDEDVLSRKVLGVLGNFALQFDPGEIRVPLGGVIDIALLQGEGEHEKVLQSYSLEATEDVAFSLKLSKPLIIHRDDVIKIHPY